MDTLISPPLLHARAPKFAEAREPSPEDFLSARALDFDLPPPHAHLRSCVVVPARNEEVAIRPLLAALADQRDLHGAKLEAASFEVVLLLNNCTDRTASVARELRRKYPRLTLHITEIAFDAENAHVGKARQALFDLAFQRFQSVRRPAGLILTTDADSQPAPDWMAQNEAEIARGVCAVGGRITLDVMEKAALPLGVRRFHLLDIAYRRAVEEMRSLFAPEPHDPFPRHHQHFGGSLAVTAAAYARAGGMPLQSFNEDVALYRAIVESGGRFRHSYRVRMTTSARMIGRAHGGLADAIHWWNDQALEARPVTVESAAAAEKRLGQLGVWCAEHPGAIPPASLSVTPEQPVAANTAEIQTTIRALRVANERLRAVPLKARLAAVMRHH